MAAHRLLALVAALTLFGVGCHNAQNRRIFESSGSPELVSVSPGVVPADGMDPLTGQPLDLCADGLNVSADLVLVVTDPLEPTDVVVPVAEVVDDTKAVFNPPPLTESAPRRAQVALQTPVGARSSFFDIFVAPSNTVSAMLDSDETPVVHPGQSGVSLQWFVFNLTADAVEIRDATVDFDDPEVRGLAAGPLPVTVDPLSFVALEILLGATPGLVSSVEVDGRVTLVYTGSSGEVQTEFDFAVRTGDAPLVSARGGSSTGPLSPGFGGAGGRVVFGGGDVELGPDPDAPPSPDVDPLPLTGIFDIDDEAPAGDAVSLGGVHNSGGTPTDPDRLQINAAGPKLAQGDLAGFSGDVVFFSDFTGPIPGAGDGDVVFIQSGPNAGTYLILEVLGSSAPVFRVTDAAGGAVSFVTTPTPDNAWSVKRASAVLEGPRTDGAVSGGRFVAAGGANFGGLADPDAPSSGDEGDVISVRLGSIAAEFLISSVVDSDQVDVETLDGGNAFLADGTGYAWSSEYVLKYTGLRSFRVGEGAVVSVAPHVDHANLLIDVSDAVGFSDAVIDLTGNDRIGGEADSGRLIVRSGGAIVLERSTLDVRGNPTGAGGGGGAIALSAGGDLLAFGSRIVADGGGGDSASGDGGAVTLTVRAVAADGSEVFLGADTVVTANGGSPAVVGGGDGAGGGAIRILNESPDGATRIQATISADGGSVGDGSGGSGGSIDVRGGSIRITNVAGDLVIDASGGASTSAGGGGFQGGDAGTALFLLEDGRFDLTAGSAVLAIGGAGDRIGGLGGSITVLGADGVNEHRVRIAGLLDAQGGGVTNTGGLSGTRAGHGRGDSDPLAGIDVPDANTGNVATTVNTPGFPRGAGGYVVKIVDNPITPTAREFAFVTAPDGSAALLPRPFRGLANTTPLSGPGRFAAVLLGINVLVDGPILVEERGRLRAPGGSPLVGRDDVDPDNTRIAGGGGGTVRLYSDLDATGGRDDLRPGPMLMRGTIDANGGHAVNDVAGWARAYANPETGIGLTTTRILAVELASEGFAVPGNVYARGGRDVLGEERAGNGGAVAVRSFDADYKIDLAEIGDANGDGVVDERDLFPDLTRPREILAFAATPIAGVIDASAGDDEPGARGGNVFVMLENQLGGGDPNGGGFEVSGRIAALGDGGVISLTTAGAGFGTVLFPALRSNLNADGASIGVSGTLQVSRTGAIAVDAEGPNARIVIDGKLDAETGTILVRLDQDGDNANGTIEVNGDVTVSGSNGLLPLGFVSVLNGSAGGTTEIDGTIRVYDEASGNGGQFDAFVRAAMSVSGTIDCDGTGAGGGIVRLQVTDFALEGGTLRANGGVPAGGGGRIEVIPADGTDGFPDVAEFHAGVLSTTGGDPAIGSTLGGGPGGSIRIGADDGPFRSVTFDQGAQVLANGGDSASGAGVEGGEVLVFSFATTLASNVEIRADGGDAPGGSVAGPGGKVEFYVKLPAETLDPRPRPGQQIEGTVSVKGGDGPTGGAGGTARFEVADAITDAEIVFLDGAAIDAGGGTVDGADGEIVVDISLAGFFFVNESGVVLRPDEVKVIE